MQWHISDTESFPFSSVSSPMLGKLGAFSAEERYSARDINDTVTYARLRGVRVMIELDMPGHAGSWCKGAPEVCPSATCTQPLNPGSAATWSLIEDLLAEFTGKASLAGLFPEGLLHLGGDEVDTSCWSQTPAVASWLQAQGLTADQAYGWFVNRTAHIAIAQGRRPVQVSPPPSHPLEGHCPPMHATLMLHSLMHRRTLPRIVSLSLVRTVE